MNAKTSSSNSRTAKFFVNPPDSSRSQSFASSPIRTFRDGAPPTKRRRLESTPTSSSFSLSTPRSSSSRPEQPTPANLHDARTASALRVLNIWSSLTERYNRRLDEDDVVDIMTGEVIKDRGVLSELPKRYNFGELVREDEAIATDSPSEAADHLAEGEEDNNDGDQDEAEETHAFPSTNSFVASKLARVVPLRPATGSSDADDLPEFLKAEAIRRELDGGDDDSSSELDGGDDPCSPELNGGDDESSSEDEFNFLPPLPTPAKRTMTPARKIAPAKFRPPKVPNPDFELDHRFVGHNQNNFYRRHRARRTSSPEVSTSIPSPPPSSSPGPSSLPPSSPFSYTPLKSNSGPQREERPNSPTLQRQPVASTSRKTLEDIINEVDLEFPPPPPRALPAFVRRRSPAFVVDLPLTGNETAPSPSPTPPSRLWTRRTLKRKRVVSSGSSSSEEGSPSDRSASQINWKGKGKSKVDEANQDSESDEGHLDNEGSVDRHSDSHPKSHSEARGPPTLERERRRR